MPVIKIHGQASVRQLPAAFVENNLIARIVRSDDDFQIGCISLDEVTETLVVSSGAISSECEQP